MQLDKINAYLQEWLDGFYAPVMGVLKIIGILVLSAILVKIGCMMIRKVFEKQKKFKYAMDSKRIDTLSTLLASAFRYTIYILAAVSILTEIVNLFNLKSVLAAAGIGGIALGFGAQSLIKDILSGFFIIAENQFAVGDLITLDTMTGTVEEMELRVTRLRSFNGDLYTVPNGEIKKVTNHTRGNKAVIVDVPVAYSADVEKVFDIANRVCKTVSGEFTTIVEEPKLLGITDLGKDSMNVRITAKTVPNEQWDVERRIRKLVKEEFEKQKIEFFDKNEILLKGNLLKGDGANG